jgi:hypothetical protein
MSVISIPRSYMGTTMQEGSVKAGLLALNSDLHFDMGVCLGLWHPFMDSRQNVFYRGNSVGAMDRGTLPEVPVWSTRKELVEVPWYDVRPGELALHTTTGVRGQCLKCNCTWDLPQRPIGWSGCFAACGNVGYASDLKLFHYENVFTGKAQVFRSVRDRVLLVGWRHTFDKLIRATIPYITKAALEQKFGVNLDPKVLDASEVDEALERRVLSREVEAN